MTFLLVVCVAGLGFAAYLLWQRNERLRLEAEADEKARAEKEALDATLPSDIEVPDVAAPDPRLANPPAVLIVEPYIEDTSPAKYAGPVTPDLPEWVSVPFESVPEGPHLLAVLKAHKYKYNPTVLKAYLNYAKAKARADLKASKRELPESFFRWLDADSDRVLAVYACKADAAKVLVMLRSLELDLGVDDARSSKFNQLVLATAIACANDAESVGIDFKDRKPKTLVIPADPRVRVNTKDPKRTLDMDDHIINFLEDHAPVSGELAGGLPHALPEIAYNRRTEKPEPYVFSRVKIPANSKRLLIAADVLAHRKYQEEFNAYMKSKGFDVNIDCGDKQIFAAMSEGVKGPYSNAILKAYRMFRTAYEKKGRLAVRDPGATAFERCAYVIRNEKKGIHNLSAPNKARMPAFPIDAPWPMLMMLAQNDMPLREREDILLRFKLEGQFSCYGEYTGGIAQQGDFQAARRLSPYAFGENSYQQILKDGGVCGRMANMHKACYTVAGVPSSTAGQPGHCAGMSAFFDKKSRKYGFGGFQYVSAGDENTHVHAPWLYMDVNAGRPSVWYQSVAFASNVNTRTFLESMAAYQIQRLMPDELLESSAGTDFLDSTVLINPFNIALAECIFSKSRIDPDRTFQIWERFESSVKNSSLKAGNKNDKNPGGLYLSTVRGMMVDRLSRADAPRDKSFASKLEKYKVIREAEIAAIKAQK